MEAAAVALDNNLPLDKSQTILVDQADSAVVVPVDSAVVVPVDSAVVAQADLAAVVQADSAVAHHILEVNLEENKLWPLDKYLLVTPTFKSNDNHIIEIV